MKVSSRNSSATLPSYSMTAPAWVGAIIILALGAGLGYLFHGSSSQTRSASAATGGQTAASTSSFNSRLPLDITLQPLLERLKDNPNDSDLLTNIGNQYYDNHDYGKAVEYYRRSLEINPGNVNVRTDMGTAIWYGGDPQGAIREYETTLKYQPNHAQTLFNMGIVKWQGEHDDNAALASWRKLLRDDPEYPDRQKVEQLMQQVQAEMKQPAGAPSIR